MNLLETLDSQTVLLVAAVVMSMLLLNLVFRVVNVNLGLILTIVVLFLVLQYFFGISPKHVWYEIGHLFRGVMRSLRNLG